MHYFREGGVPVGDLISLSPPPECRQAFKQDRNHDCPKCCGCPLCGADVRYRGGAGVWCVNDKCDWDGAGPWDEIRRRGRVRFQHGGEERYHEWVRQAREGGESEADYE